MSVFFRIPQFLDLVKDKDFKIPGDRERRDRTLRDVICSRRRPVVLIIDEAHDLHTQTLVQLKRLVELVEVSGGILSVVLAGHPKFRTPDLPDFSKTPN